MTVKFLSREESEHNECQRIELTFKTILVIHPQVFMRIRRFQRLILGGGGCLPWIQGKSSVDTYKFCYNVYLSKH